MGINSDFVVESNGLCFVCLKRAGTSPEIKDFIKHESEYPQSDPTHFPIYSLKCLSRFLGTDLKKVFKNQKDIAPHLLIKVEQAALKAELCDNCSKLIRKFSRLHQHLEKSKIELRSCVQDIHEKLIEANEEERMQALIKMAQEREHFMTNPSNGWLEKLDVLKVLRTQVIDNGSRLICSSTPRIKVENMTKKEVGLKKQKIKQKWTEKIRTRQLIVNKPCRDNPEVQVEKIKLESPTGSSKFRDDGRDWYDNSNYSDDIEVHYDEDAATDLTSSEGDLTAEEVKVDIRHGRILSKPTHHPKAHDPHNSKTVKMTKCAAPKTKPGSKLSGAKHVFNPIKIQGKFQCNSCIKQYKSKLAASRHFKSAHLKLRYNCSICAKVFVSQFAYRVHYRAVHMGAGLNCSNCNRSFVASRSLERHQRINNCTFSNGSKRVDQRGHIEAKHLRRSTRYACSQCAKVFVQSSNLKSHIKSVHLEIREHHCNVCQKRYTTKFNLEYHKLTVHASGSLPT